MGSFIKSFWPSMPQTLASDEVLYAQITSVRSGYRRLVTFLILVVALGMSIAGHLPADLFSANGPLYVAVAGWHDLFIKPMWYVAALGLGFIGCMRLRLTAVMAYYRVAKMSKYSAEHHLAAHYLKRRHNSFLRGYVLLAIALLFSQFVVALHTPGSTEIWRLADMLVLAYLMTRYWNLAMTRFLPSCLFEVGFHNIEAEWAKAAERRLRRFEQFGDADEPVAHNGVDDPQ